MNGTPNTEEFERCVMCGKLTCVPVSMPIDWREDYEVGCGQLCSDCKRGLRKPPRKKTALSNVQILLAVERSRKERKK